MRLLASLACLLVLASCGPSSPDPTAGAKPTPIRIQLNWVPEPEFGGLYAAETHGFFKEEGLDVELVKGGPGVPAPQLAATGNVEFAVVAGEQILTLRDAGGDLVAVFASFQSDPMGIMVHESNPARSLEELWKSKSTVAAETDLAFISLLNQRFGGKDLTFVQHSGSAVQFAADPKLAQQCFVFAEPVALELQGVKTRVFPSSESGYNPYNVVIATKASYAKEHPEIVAKLRTALERGWRSYLDDPASTNAHMASLNPAMSKEAMDLAATKQAALIESADTKTLGLGAMTAERWAGLAKQLAELGRIKTAPDTASLFVWKETARP